jgi:hypothetical protein
MDDVWMRTYSGARVHILNPQPEEIRVEDIAHALSHLCRFCGHVPRFYSVAQHSVVVSDLLEDLGAPLAFWGLLHDASEAYLHDLHRPLKRSLPGYSELESRMMAAICDRFGLPRRMPEPVRHADNVALATEFRDLYGEPLVNCVAWGRAQPMETVIRPHCSEVAEDLFLVRFEALARRAA